MSIEVRFGQNFSFALISRRLLNLAQATLSVIGQKYVEETKKNIVRKKLFQNRSKRLYGSIKALPVSKTRVVIFGAGEDSEYGKYLEFGTKGPYVIRPKEREYLIIPTESGYIRKKKVIHPGIKARHYFFGNYEEKMRRAIEEGRNYFYNKVKEELSK